MILNRRAFLCGAVSATLAMLLDAEAQPVVKLHRIGVLSPETPPPGLLDTVHDELRQLGHVEGKTFSIEARSAEGRNERLPALADELITSKVDVILAINTSAAHAAKKATTVVPIVITRVADPVKSGLVTSLSQPDRNITGVSFMPDVIAVKGLEMLKEALPRLTRAGALWYADNPGAAIVVNELDVAATRLKLTLRRLPIRGPGDLAQRSHTGFSRRINGSREQRRYRADRDCRRWPRHRLAAFRHPDGGRYRPHLREPLPEPIDGLYVLGNIVTAIHRQQIIQLSAAHRIPTVYWWRQVVSEGGLMSYGIDFGESWRGAAQYVDRILRGANPGTLPIQQPTKFEFVINLKTAKALNLTIPPSLLVRADQVIDP